MQRLVHTNIHKGLIKLVLSLGIGVSLLGFGSVTANASHKGYYGHFDSRRITYHIDSTSKHYRGIWKVAIKNWNDGQNVVKLRKAKNKKNADLRLTSRAQMKDDYVYDLNVRTFDEDIDTVYVKLNRSFFDNGAADDKYRIVLATQAIGNGLGLNYIHGDSIMSDSNIYTLSAKITSVEVSNLKAAYKGVK